MRSMRAIARDMIARGLSDGSDVIGDVARWELADSGLELELELNRETLRTLAWAADFAASESDTADRGGRCAAYLRHAAAAARAAARDDPA
jgi:uncharacterized protein CbrC (UPF0167 family)